VVETFDDSALESTPIAFLVVTLLCVGLRLRTRFLHPTKGRRFWWDDYFIIAAQVGPQVGPLLSISGLIHYLKIVYIAYCACLVVLYGMTNNAVGLGAMGMVHQKTIVCVSQLSSVGSNI
jgi:hypothetical protein